MLLDLDPEKAGSRVQVSKEIGKENESSWLIEARGHTGNVYGCLRAMDCEGAAKEFFDMVTRSDDEPDLHDRIADSNWTFKKVQEQFRYGDVTNEEWPGTSAAPKSSKRGRRQSDLAEASGSGKKPKQSK